MPRYAGAAAARRMRGGQQAATRNGEAVGIFFTSGRLDSCDLNAADVLT